MVESPTPLLRTVHLDPVRADVAVDCSLLTLQEGDEIRGKLQGPRCRFASTIEIAYPMRQTAAERRIVVPEPSLWSPQTPFIYQGKFEWLRAGQKIAEFRVAHALLNLRHTAAGWRLNGRALDLQIIEVESPGEQELLHLRERGCNALAPQLPRTDLWEAAAWLGFLMIVKQPEKLPPELRRHFLTTALPGETTPAT